MPAQSMTLHRKNGIHETLTMGTDLQVCIYDKRRELVKQLKSDPVKVALMLENVLGTDFFEADTPLTRIEFRLRRCVLKDMGINTVQDLLEKETSLALYCSRKWFRVLKEPKKEGHSSEQETSDFWQEVQGFFLLEFPGVEGHREEVKRTKKTELSCDSKHLHAQSGGCRATAGVLDLGVNADFVTFLRYLLQKTGESASKIYQRYRERAAELGARLYGAGLNAVCSCCENYKVIQEEIERARESCNLEQT